MTRQQSTIYKNLSKYYDTIMNNIDYTRWYHYLSDLIAPYIVSINEDLSLLELGSGTGNLLLKFADRFDKVIGVDFSEDMLQVCGSKMSSEMNVKIIRSDIRQLPFKTKFNVIIAAFDTINYINFMTDDFIVNVKRVMYNDSIFLFDFITDVFGSVYNGQSAVTKYDNFIHTISWSFNKHSGLLETTVVITDINETRVLLDEVHYQHCVNYREIKGLLKKHFSTVEMFTHLDMVPASKYDECIQVVARF